jgi:hypothetical protein
VYAVLAKSDSGLYDGNIVAVFDLEGLPMIGHNSDFEDISIAHCPFQAGVVPANRTWCIWIFDTGYNFGKGKDEIYVYVVPEPLILNKQPLLQIEVQPEDLHMFKVTYDPLSYHKNNIPNIEAAVTNPNGSRFWAIQKTFSDHGNGPAGIWESPDLSSYQSMKQTNRNSHVSQVCTRNRTLGGGNDDSNDNKKGHYADWKCRLRLNYAGDREGSEDDQDQTLLDMLQVDQVVVHDLFLSQVNEIENPYPDCTRENEINEEEFAVYDYPDSLPFCPEGKEREPENHSCKKQKKWGKCEEEWLIEKNYCERTCKRCRPPKPEQPELMEVKSVEPAEQPEPTTDDENNHSAEDEEDQWMTLERNCNETKRDHRNVRNIAGADLHHSGTRLLVATYGGIFEYHMETPFDLSNLTFARQVSTTHRDGTEEPTDSGEHWKGQEGVAYDYTGIPSHQRGKGIWSVSEHHQGLYYIGCKGKQAKADPLAPVLE